MDVFRPRWMMGVITVGARCESLEVAGRRKALRIHREGADDLLPDDEGARGRSGCAAPRTALPQSSSIVRTLDAAAALLQLIPTVIGP